jgi:hypothetical protein
LDFFEAALYQVVGAKFPEKVRELLVEGRSYIVCSNENQAKKDAADREAIIALTC